MSQELKNEYYNDCYFSIESGYLESKFVFIDGNSLEERLEASFNIGETGFGTGLNLLVLEDYIESNKITDLQLTFTSVEKYPLDSLVVKNTLSNLKEVSESSLYRHIELFKLIEIDLKNGWNTFLMQRSWGVLTINLFIGDILDSSANYPTINDCWFLDGHSPDKNPDMWNENVFKIVADNSKKGTTFATFTAAGVVKRGLREVGFDVKRKKGYGIKRHMINGIL